MFIDISLENTKTLFEFYYVFLEPKRIYINYYYI